MKQKKLRENIIHIQMREITGGVSRVQEHLPQCRRSKTA